MARLAPKLSFAVPSLASIVLVLIRALCSSAMPSAASFSFFYFSICRSVPARKSMVPQSFRMQTLTAEVPAKTDFSQIAGLKGFLQNLEPRGRKQVIDIQYTHVVSQVLLPAMALYNFVVRNHSEEGPPWPASYLG